MFQSGTEVLPGLKTIIPLFPSGKKRNIGPLLREQIGEAAVDYLEIFIDIDSPKTLVVSTTTRFNLLQDTAEPCTRVVNLHRVNDIRYLNKFFEAVNERLPYAGLFFGLAETKPWRKQRILGKYPRPINYLVYCIDFLIKRILPKIQGLKKVYFAFTQGRNRVLTRSEILGRLISCGFDIVDERVIGGMFYWVVRKSGNPKFDYNATYGPIIRLKRVGKGGELINVYKFRTMHPYSEYLQHYIYARNKLDTGGKFKDDFRITTLGSIMRKLWIDELPMLINWLYKRNMKLVGVRPLSQHYYGLYSKELQQKRIKYKPGLVPPYYADSPKNMQEIMDSEARYLDAYEKHPFLTDLRYFFKVFLAIAFRKVRSH